MTLFVELTPDATRAILSKEVAAGREQNFRIVAAACTTMLAQEGDISPKDFKAEMKATLATKPIGDSSIYKYIHNAGLAYREHVTAWQNRLTRQNDRSAEAVFNMILTFLFGDPKEGVKGRYKDVDTMVKKLTPEQAERTPEQKADAAVARVIATLTEGKVTLTEDHLARVRKALDKAIATIGNATADRILADDASVTAPKVATAPVDNSPAKLAAHRKAKAAEQKAAETAARDAAFAKAS